MEIPIRMSSAKENIDSGRRHDAVQQQQQQQSQSDLLPSSGREDTQSGRREDFQQQHDEQTEHQPSSRRPSTRENIDAVPNFLPEEPPRREERSESLRSEKDFSTGSHRPSADKDIIDDENEVSSSRQRAESQESANSRPRRFGILV